MNIKGYNHSKEVRERMENIDSRNASLKSVRDEYMDSWRRVADFIYPYAGRLKGVLHGRNAADKGLKAISGTAIKAHETLAAGMHTGLASPSRPWFKLEPEDKGFRHYGVAQRYAEGIQKSLYKFFGKSNFYRLAHSRYGDMGGFGIGAMGFVARPGVGFAFIPVPIGTFVGDVSQWGEVDTFIREESMTARQMAQKFGYDNLSRHAKNSIDNGNSDQRFTVVHSVMPREDFDPRKLDFLNMPFESVYYEQGCSEQALAVGGYKSFPYLVTRWHVQDNSFFGESPGILSLCENQMLNEMCKDRIHAVHLSLRPPMKVPSMYSRRLNLLPGGQNPVEQNQKDSVEPLYQIRPDIAAVTALVEESKNDIRKFFYNDLFMMLAVDSERVKTAYEAQQLVSEKMTQLGPVVERLQNELLDPVINRGVQLLYDMGAIPPAPPELEGVEVDIEYVSVLAQAQRAAAMDSIIATTSFAGKLAESDPTIRHKLNFWGALDEYHQASGAPSSLIRSNEEAEKLATQEAEQMQKMQQMQQQQQAIGQGVDIADKLSKMDTQGKNALTDAIQEMQQ